MLIAAGALLLAACSAQRLDAQILSAAPNPELGTLDVAASVPLNATLLDALDHGIPLRFQFQVSASGQQPHHDTMELRYLPMTKRYQLIADFGAPRSFASRVQLLSAFDRVRLPLGNGAAGAGSVRMRLDTGSLPAPMRLPALLDADWHLSSNTVSWGSAP